jgi:hypothetical protein
MDTKLSIADRERIADLLRKQCFLDAVKLYRSITGCDLRTAKLDVEQIQDSLGIPRRSFFHGLCQDLSGPLLLIAIALAIIAIIWFLTK